MLSALMCKVKPFFSRRELWFELCSMGAALLFSTFTLFPGSAPLGPAVSAAMSLAGFSPLFPFIGALAGTLISQSYASAAAASAYVSICMVVGSLRGSLRKTDKLLILTASEIFILPFFYMRDLNSCMIGLAELAITVMGAVIMHRAFTGLVNADEKRRLSDAEQVAFYVFISLAVACMGKAELWGVNFSSILAAFFTLTATRAKGLIGVAAAVVLGAGRVLSGSTDLVFVGCLVSCALLSAALRRMGKWGTVTGFMAAAAAISFVLDASRSISVIEAGVACAAFCFLKPSVIERLDSYALPQGKRYDELAQLRLRAASLSSVTARIAELFLSDGDSMRRFAGTQLMAVSAAIKTLGSVDDKTGTDNRLSIETGAAAVPKSGNKLTGDSMAMRSFDTRALLMLSDGMGSGEEAHRESLAAVALFGDMISVGFELSDALSCVNRLMMMKCSADMYATLDAVLISLDTGSARFIKFGAPPAFIVRSGKAHMMYAEALPVGIVASAVPAVHTVKLRQNDMLVMMTDGVFDALGRDCTAAVTETASKGLSPQQTADELLRLAGASGCADDMSIIVSTIF